MVWHNNRQGMTQEREKSITSFRDLEVYQKTYKACIDVMLKIIPNLPDSEKFDLKKQLSSSAKAIPRLIGSAPEGGKCSMFMS